MLLINTQIKVTTLQNLLLNCKATMYCREIKYITIVIVVLFW